MSLDVSISIVYYIVYREIGKFYYCPPAGDLRFTTWAELIQCIRLLDSILISPMA